MQGLHIAGLPDLLRQSSNVHGRCWQQHGMTVKGRHFCNCTACIPVSAIVCTAVMHMPSLYAVAQIRDVLEVELRFS